LSAHRAVDGRLAIPGPGIDLEGRRRLCHAMRRPSGHRLSLLIVPTTATIPAATAATRSSVTFREYGARSLPTLGRTTSLPPVSRERKAELPSGPGKGSSARLEGDVEPGPHHGPLGHRGSAMAVGPYILIQTGVGQASDVAAKVRALPGVGEGHSRALRRDRGLRCTRSLGWAVSWSVGCNQSRGDQHPDLSDRRTLTTGDDGVRRRTPDRPSRHRRRERVA